jgi:hypothetical protein
LSVQNEVCAVAKSRGNTKSYSNVNYNSSSLLVTHKKKITFFACFSAVGLVALTVWMYRKDYKKKKKSSSEMRQTYPDNEVTQSTDPNRMTLNDYNKLLEKMDLDKDLLSDTQNDIVGGCCVCFESKNNMFSFNTMLGDDLHNTNILCEDCLGTCETCPLCFKEIEVFKEGKKFILCGGIDKEKLKELGMSTHEYIANLNYRYPSDNRHLSQLPDFKNN